MSSPYPAVDPEKYRRLEAELPQIFEDARRAGHDVDADPYLSVDRPGLVQRYLIATDENVAESARRLRATITWRREWRILEYYRPGAAEQLLLEANNPGTEMYFASSNHVDRRGRPYMVGRAGLINPANMHPWRHLRAGVFVLERAAMETIRKGCGYGSYILDIGDVHHQGTISCLGGHGRTYKESNNPYYKRGASTEADPRFVEQFGNLTSGMQVLRAAINIANKHYPELMDRAVVLRSNWLFAAAFKVFSLWMHHRSRNKFVFVGSGLGSEPMSRLLDWYSPEELPREFGGTGWSLQGDGFIAKAAEAYDADPNLGAFRPVGGFAGENDSEVAVAARDARERAAERGGRRAPSLAEALDSLGEEPSPPGSPGPRPGRSSETVSCASSCWRRQKAEAAKAADNQDHWRPPPAPVPASSGRQLSGATRRSDSSVAPDAVAAKSVGTVDVLLLLAVVVVAMLAGILAGPVQLGA